MYLGIYLYMYLYRIHEELRWGIDRFVHRDIINIHQEYQRSELKIGSIGIPMSGALITTTNHGNAHNVDLMGAL